jgi:hypothetical protein
MDHRRTHEVQVLACVHVISQGVKGCDNKSCYYIGTWLVTKQSFNCTFFRFIWGLLTLTSFVALAFHRPILQSKIKNVPVQYSPVQYS